MECEGFDITYTRIAGDKHNRQNSGTTTTASTTGMMQQQQHHHPLDGMPSTDLGLTTASSSSSIEYKVNTAIEAFLKNLSQIGPELLSVCHDQSRREKENLHFICMKRWLSHIFLLLDFKKQSQGCLTLSFFERRASRQLFGLVSHEERVVYVGINIL